MHSDRAKRCSDTHRLHRSALGTEAIGRYIAVRISDGQSDGTLYDTKRDAVRHQKHNERLYAYLCIGPDDLSVCEAEATLEAFEAIMAAGLNLTDPDHPHGGREVIQRATVEDQRSLIRSIRSGGRIPASNLTLN